MGAMVAFLARRKHLFLLLIYPFIGLGFAYCEAQVTVAKYIIEWPWVDRALPFVPAMVWPYVFWYALVAFPFAWLGWRDGPAFTRYAWFIYGSMATTYVLYLLFPNGEALRPSLAGRNGWDISVLQWLYDHDTTTNVNPSLHVIGTLGAWIALAKDRFLGRWRWFQVTLSVVSLVVISSTVLVKQHSVLDILGGIIWSGLWYLVVYRIKPLTPAK
jgi:hypothetical protein